MIVVDASVALKWVFADEELIASANVLLDDDVEGRVDLITPNLFPYEIISGINVAVNRGGIITESLAYRAIHYITSLGIELRDFEDLVEPTFRMARQYGLTPYPSRLCIFSAGGERKVRSCHGRQEALQIDRGGTCLDQVDRRLPHLRLNFPDP